jgi:hypothetical protein
VVGKVACGAAGQAQQQMALVNKDGGCFASSPFVKHNPTSSCLICGLEGALWRDPKLLVTARGNIDRGHSVSLTARINGRKPRERNRDGAQGAHTVKPVRQRDAI